jgi:hypothetical protein
LKKVSFFHFLGVKWGWKTTTIKMLSCLADQQQRCLELGEVLWKSHAVKEKDKCLLLKNCSCTKPIGQKNLELIAGI